METYFKNGRFHNWAVTWFHYKYEEIFHIRVILRWWRQHYLNLTLRSRAPPIDPLAELESRSSLLSACGSNMDSKNKSYNKSTLRSFKHSCFQHLRKQHNDCTIHDFSESFLSSAQCLLSTLQLVYQNICRFFELFQLERTYIWISPVGKTFTDSFNNIRAHSCEAIPSLTFVSWIWP